VIDRDILVIIFMFAKLGSLQKQQRHVPKLQVVAITINILHVFIAFFLGYYFSQLPEDDTHTLWANIGIFIIQYHHEACTYTTIYSDERSSNLTKRSEHQLRSVLNNRMTKDEIVVE